MKIKKSCNELYRLFSIILLSFALAAAMLTGVFAATNVSILYGWNGTDNVAVRVDASGRLMTTINLTESIGLFPDADNLRDLGAAALRWRSLYVFDMIATGNLNVGTINASNGLNVTAGNVLLTVTSGNVGIGTTSPYNTLTVVGSVGVSGSLNASSINSTGGAYFATSSGNVGIGTASPNVKLTVIGGINASGGLNVTAGNVLLATTSGNVGIGTASPGSLLDVQGAVTINGASVTLSQDTDFVLSGGINGVSFDSTTLSIDATNNRVGIGTSTPTEALTVVGKVNATGQTNHTLGNFSIIQFNSTCVGFRFNGTTGGGIFSCAP